MLGPDLATAHFVIARGGKVKFVGQDGWHCADSEGKFILPDKYVAGVHVEALDASSTNMRYEALDNFGKWTLVNRCCLLYIMQTKFYRENIALFCLLGIVMQSH